MSEYIQLHKRRSQRGGKTLTSLTDFPINVRVFERAMARLGWAPAEVQLLFLSRGPLLYALIIGIDKYRCSEVSNLRGAVADSNAVERYLKEELMVPSDHTRILRDAEATRSAIIEAFLNLKKDSRIQMGDAILVYYAGHGSETDPPAGWETGGSNIQMLIPHDFGAVPDGTYVHGIPDRTVASLLDRLSKEKGDNVTVVFDCCHSGSGTRTGGIDSTRLARVVSIPSNVPSDLDEYIWRDSGSNRGANIAPGFLQSGLRSHVLLAACGAKELAMEVKGRGVFTTAFLEILTTVGADKLTYSDVLQRMHTLPGGPSSQNPQCEGYNQNRIIFDGKAPPQGRTFYLVHINTGKFVLEAGAAHGLTEGAEFTIHRDSVFPSEVPPLGTLVAVEVRAFRTILDVPFGATRFELTQPAFALQIKAGIEEDLRIHVDMDERLNEVFAAIAEEMQSTSHQHRRILLVEKDKAELSVVLENGRVVFDILNPVVFQHGLTRMPFRVNTNVGDVYPVICAAAHYHWHIRRINARQPLRDKVQIEFTKVKLTDDKSDANYGSTIVVPDGPNLNISGTIDLIVDEYSMYGMTIVNRSNVALYASLFFFDNSDLSITSYYQPPTAGGYKVDPSLEPQGSLPIGYGSGGVPPFNYLLRDGEDVDIGFLKLFLTTEQVDFSYISQSSPFSSDSRVVKQTQPKIVGIWDTILVTVVQRRGLLEMDV